MITKHCDYCEEEIVDETGFLVEGEKFALNGWIPEPMVMITVNKIRDNLPHDPYKQLDVCRSCLVNILEVIIATEKDMVT